jgi:hypothetical protein
MTRSQLTVALSGLALAALFVAPQLLPRAPIPQPVDIVTPPTPVAVSWVSTTPRPAPLEPTPAPVSDPQTLELTEPVVQVLEVVTPRAPVASPPPKVSVLEEVLPTPVHEPEMTEQELIEFWDDCPGCGMG